jgi:hypothetical protein
MAKLQLPSDFARKIAEALGVSVRWVDEWFDVSEDKQGYFIATLRPGKFLEKNQFKTLCALARDLGGEGYLHGAKAWKIPGPYAEKSASPTKDMSAPSPIAELTCPVCGETVRVSHYGINDHRVEH